MATSSPPLTTRTSGVVVSEVLVDRYSHAVARHRQLLTRDGYTRGVPLPHAAQTFYPINIVSEEFNTTNTRNNEEAVVDAPSSATPGAEGVGWRGNSVMVNNSTPSARTPNEGATAVQPSHHAETDVRWLRMAWPVETTNTTTADRERNGTWNGVSNRPVNLSRPTNGNHSSALPSSLLSAPSAAAAAIGVNVAARNGEAVAEALLSHFHQLSSPGILFTFPPALAPPNSDTTPTTHTNTNSSGARQRAAQVASDLLSPSGIRSTRQSSFASSSEHLAFEETRVDVTGSGSKNNSSLHSSEKMALHARRTAQRAAAAVACAAVPGGRLSPSNTSWLLRRRLPVPPLKEGTTSLPNRLRATSTSALQATTTPLSSARGNGFPVPSVLSRTNVNGPSASQTAPSLPSSYHGFRAGHASRLPPPPARYPHPFHRRSGVLVAPPPLPFDSSPLFEDLPRPSPETAGIRRLEDEARQLLQNIQNGFREGRLSYVADLLDALLEDNHQGRKAFVVLLLALHGADVMVELLCTAPFSARRAEWMGQKMRMEEIEYFAQEQQQQSSGAAAVAPFSATAHLVPHEEEEFFWIPPGARGEPCPPVSNRGAATRPNEQPCSPPQRSTAATSPGGPHTDSPRPSTTSTQPTVIVPGMPPRRSSSLAFSSTAAPFSPSLDSSTSPPTSPRTSAGTAFPLTPTHTAPPAGSLMAGDSSAATSPPTRNPAGGFPSSSGAAGRPTATDPTAEATVAAVVAAVYESSSSSTSQNLSGGYGGRRSRASDGLNNNNNNSNDSNNYIPPIPLSWSDEQSYTAVVSLAIKVLADWCLSHSGLMWYLYDHYPCLIYRMLDLIPTGVGHFAVILLEHMFSFTGPVIEIAKESSLVRLLHDCSDYVLALLCRVLVPLVLPGEVGSGSMGGTGAGSAGGGANGGLMLSSSSSTASRGANATAATWLHRLLLFPDPLTPMYRVQRIIDSNVLFLQSLPHFMDRLLSLGRHTRPPTLRQPLVAQMLALELGVFGEVMNELQQETDNGATGREVGNAVTSNQNIGVTDDEVIGRVLQELSEGNSSRNNYNSITEVNTNNRHTIINPISGNGSIAQVRPNETGHSSTNTMSNSTVVIAAQRHQAGVNLGNSSSAITAENSRERATRNEERTRLEDYPHPTRTTTRASLTNNASSRSAGASVASATRNEHALERLLRGHDPALSELLLTEHQMNQTQEVFPDTLIHTVIRRETRPEFQTAPEPYHHSILRDQNDVDVRNVRNSYQYSQRLGPSHRDEGSASSSSSSTDSSRPSTLSPNLIQEDEEVSNDVSSNEEDTEEDDAIFEEEEEEEELPDQFYLDTSWLFGQYNTLHRWHSKDQALYRPRDDNQEALFGPIYLHRLKDTMERLPDLDVQLLLICEARREVFCLISTFLCTFFFSSAFHRAKEAQLVKLAALMFEGVFGMKEPPPLTTNASADVGGTMTSLPQSLQSRSRGDRRRQPSGPLLHALPLAEPLEMHGAAAVERSSLLPPPQLLPLTASAVFVEDAMGGGKHPGSAHDATGSTPNRTVGNVNSARVFYDRFGGAFCSRVDYAHYFNAPPHAGYLAALDKSMTHRPLWMKSLPAFHPHCAEERLSVTSSGWWVNGSTHPVHQHVRLAHQLLEKTLMNVRKMTETATGSEQKQHDESSDRPALSPKVHVIQEMVETIPGRAQEVTLITAIHEEEVTKTSRVQKMCSKTFFIEWQHRPFLMGLSPSHNTEKEKDSASAGRERREGECCARSVQEHSFVDLEVERGMQYLAAANTRSVEETFSKKKDKDPYSIQADAERCCRGAWYRLHWGFSCFHCCLLHSFLSNTVVYASANVALLVDETTFQSLGDGGMGSAELDAPSPMSIQKWEFLRCLSEYWNAQNLQECLLVTRPTSSKEVRASRALLEEDGWDATNLPRASSEDVRSHSCAHHDGDVEQQEAEDREYARLFIAKTVAMLLKRQEDFTVEADALSALERYLRCYSILSEDDMEGRLNQAFCHHYAPHYLRSSKAFLNSPHCHTAAASPLVRNRQETHRVETPHLSSATPPMRPSRQTVPLPPPSPPPIRYSSTTVVPMESSKRGETTNINSQHQPVSAAAEDKKPAVAPPSHNRWVWRRPLAEVIYPLSGSDSACAAASGEPLSKAQLNQHRRNRREGDANDIAAVPFSSSDSCASASVPLFYRRSSTYASGVQDEVAQLLLPSILKDRIYNATVVPGLSASLLPLWRLEKTNEVLSVMLLYHYRNLKVLCSYVTEEVSLQDGVIPNPPTNILLKNQSSPQKTAPLSHIERGADGVWPSSTVTLSVSPPNKSSPSASTQSTGSMALERTQTSLFSCCAFYGSETSRGRHQQMETGGDRTTFNTVKKGKGKNSHLKGERIRHHHQHEEHYHKSALDEYENADRCVAVAGYANRISREEECKDLIDEETPNNSFTTTERSEKSHPRDGHSHFFTGSTSFSSSSDSEKSETPDKLNHYANGEEDNHPHRTANSAAETTTAITGTLGQVTTQRSGEQHEDLQSYANKVERQMMKAVSDFRLQQQRGGEERIQATKETATATQQREEKAIMTENLPASMMTNKTFEISLPQLPPSSESRQPFQTLHIPGGWTSALNRPPYPKRTGSGPLFPLALPASLHSIHPPLERREKESFGSVLLRRTYSLGYYTPFLPRCLVLSLTPGLRSSANFLYQWQRREVLEAEEEAAAWNRKNKRQQETLISSNSLDSVHRRRRTHYKTDRIIRDLLLSCGGTADLEDGDRLSEGDGDPLGRVEQSNSESGTTNIPPQHSHVNYSRRGKGCDANKKLEREHHPAEELSVARVEVHRSRLVPEALLLPSSSTEFLWKMFVYLLRLRRVSREAIDRIAVHRYRLQRRRAEWVEATKCLNTSQNDCSCLDANRTGKKKMSGEEIVKAMQSALEQETIRYSTYMTGDLELLLDDIQECPYGPWLKKPLDPFFDADDLALLRTRGAPQGSAPEGCPPPASSSHNHDHRPPSKYGNVDPKTARHKDPANPTALSQLGTPSEVQTSGSSTPKSAVWDGPQTASCHLRRDEDDEEGESVAPPLWIGAPDSCRLPLFDGAIEESEGLAALQPLSDSLLAEPHKLLYSLLSPLRAEAVNSTHRLCVITTTLLIVMREAKLFGGVEGIRRLLRRLKQLCADEEGGHQPEAEQRDVEDALAGSRTAAGPVPLSACRPQPLKVALTTTRTQHTEEYQVLLKTATTTMSSTRDASMDFTAVAAAKPRPDPSGTEASARPSNALPHVQEHRCDVHDAYSTSLNRLIQVHLPLRSVCICGHASPPSGKGSSYPSSALLYSRVETGTGETEAVPVPSTPSTVYPHCPSRLLFGTCTPQNAAIQFHARHGTCFFKNLFRLLCVWLGHYSVVQRYTVTLFFSTEVCFLDYKTVALLLLRELPEYFADALWENDSEIRRMNDETDAEAAHPPKDQEKRKATSRPGTFRRHFVYDDLEEPQLSGEEATAANATTSPTTDGHTAAAPSPSELLEGSAFIWDGKTHRPCWSPQGHPCSNHDKHKDRVFHNHRLDKTQTKDEDEEWIRAEWNQVQQLHRYPQGRGQQEVPCPSDAHTWEWWGAP